MKCLADAKIDTRVNYQPALAKARLPKEYTGYFTEQKYTPKEVTDWRIFKKDEEQVELICAKSAFSLTLSGKVGFEKGPAIVRAVCDSFAYGTPNAVGRTIGNIPWKDGLPWGTSDDVLKADLEALWDLGLNLKCEWFWLPSVGVVDLGEGLEHAVKTLHISGNVTSSKILYTRGTDGQETEDFHCCGVLPILSLPSDTKIVEGKGREIWLA